MRGRHPWALVVLVILAAPATASSSLATPLHATLRPSTPLHAAPDIASSLQFEAYYEALPRAGPGAMDAFYSSSSVRLTVYETRRQSVANGSIDSVEGTHVARGATIHLRDAVLRDEEHQEESLWSGHPTASAALLFRPAAQCAITARPPQQDPDLARTLLRTLLDVSVRPLVEADCDVESFQASGGPSLVVFGSRIVAHGTDAETGELRQIVISTGAFRQPNATVPLMEDLVHRRLLIQGGPDGTLRVEPPASAPIRLRVTSVAFGVVGTLDVPSSPGVVEWGTWSKSPAPAFRADGAFGLTSPRHGEIEVVGRAFMGPWELAPTPGAGTPGAPTLTAFAAALLLLPAAWKGVMVLFSRLLGQDALKHRRRRQLYDLSAAQPGITAVEAERLLAWPRRAVWYNARVLHAKGFLLLRRIGRHTALFPASVHDLRQQERLFWLRDPRSQSLLSLVREAPGRPQHELARILGISQPQVSRLLSRLGDAGLLPPPRPASESAHPGPAARATLTQ